MGYRTYTCPIARSCGGCEWLAVPYPIQLKRKREMVQELLDEALGRGAVEVSEVLGARETLHYRYKAATPFAPGKRGQIWCGFYARGTHRIVRCTDCLAEVEGSRSLFEAIAHIARSLRINAYNEDAHSGLLRHAILRSGWKTGENLLTVVANARELPNEREFTQRVKHAAREAGLPLTSLVLNTNTRRTNAMLGFSSRTLFGSGVMHDELLGTRFEIGPSSFYQTNPAQTEVLYRTVFENAGLGPGMRVLDAYCGTGTIGLCAAKLYDGVRVIGVERTGEAVDCARRNAAANGLAKRSDFVAADATEWIRAQVTQDALGKFDCVILDPPRAGSTEDFLQCVTALAPERLAYVSCNPVSLTRDLAFLSKRGWHVQSAVPVDLFPHTKHIETVVVLGR